MPTAPLMIISSITSWNSRTVRAGRPEHDDGAHHHGRVVEHERDPLARILGVTEQQQLGADAGDAEQEDGEQDAARGVGHRRLNRNSSILPSGARYISVLIGVVPAIIRSVDTSRPPRSPIDPNCDLADLAGVL